MVNKKMWLHKFDPSWDFVCLRPQLTMGEKIYQAGQRVDVSLVRPDRLKNLYLARKIGPIGPDDKAVETKPVTITKKEPKAIEVSATVEPKIVGPKKGGWFALMLGDEQIGESSRDRDEIELALMEWQDANTNESGSQDVSEVTKAST